MIGVVFSRFMPPRRHGNRRRGRLRGAGARRLRPPTSSIYRNDTGRSTE
jgi:hypothetical protein